MDKASFINKIREAEKTRPDTKLPVFTKDDTVSKPATLGSAKEAFVRNFKANHGDVFESVGALTEFLKDKGCKRGVADAKLKDTFGLENSFELLREFDRSNPDSYDFGISKASMAIGESGAIVLKDKDTSDRLATIAPWVHIAVLRESDIVETISDALENTIKDAKENPYSIYIAAPSKTTDVEGVLVEGVHGPGCQICLIIK